MPDKQTRDAVDLFDAEYSQILLSGGMSAGTYPCFEMVHDKRHVIILSRKYMSDMTIVSVKTQEGCVSKEKPMAVDDYNRHMTGIDMSDQMVGYHFFIQKAVKS